MNEVTNKIKTFCTDTGISEEELAERTGLSPEQIKMIIAGDNIPSLSSLIKIARALGVRLGTFLDDSENFGPVVNRSADHQQAATFSSQLSTANSHMDFFSLASRKAAVPACAAAAGRSSSVTSRVSSSSAKCPR